MLNAAEYGISPLLELPKQIKIITLIAKKIIMSYNVFVMKIYIVNSQININTKELLSTYGFVAGVNAHPNLPTPEKHHADMQFAKIDNHTLIRAPKSSVDASLDGISLLTGSVDLYEKYPDNIAYNILRCGEHFFHNLKHTAPEVKNEINNRNFNLLNTNQGYAGCSSICVPLQDGEILLLSSDKGIISSVNKLGKRNIHTEYFEETKSIILPGYDHGFIGGCCGYDEELGLLVYGKINGQLKVLSERYNFPILSIFDGPLTDIGGILVMYPCL